MSLNFLLREKKSLDHMSVYAKDLDSSADYWILNSFKTHPQSPEHKNIEQI